ncbi:MAG: MurT ligase domain-containing protein [Acidimicrobiales bacterium]
MSESVPPAPGTRARAAAWATVAVGGLSRRFKLGSGSVVGGRVGLLIDPTLLERLGAGRRVALVTGTNGKTTTARLLRAALATTGDVASNGAGSNLPAGLAAALAASPAARAVLEVDEGYLGRAVAALHPEVVVLLNLSRDQLDRVSEVRMVAARFRAALENLHAGVVVANADDPLVVWAAGTAPKVVWAGAGGSWRSDASGCPACGGQIEFDPSGTGWSSACGLSRPAPAVELQNDGVVTAAGVRFGLRLALPGRFNRANAAMAAAAAEQLGVPLPDALAAMAGVRDVEGRFATVSHGSVTARLLLAKNPAGWAELLDLLDEDPTSPVVVGINARVADGHDPSWLWDVAFERLAGRRVVATGERAADLAVRLRYAGVSHVTVHDQLAALGAAGSSPVDYVGNYTAFQDLRVALRRTAAAAPPSPRVFPTPVAVPAARPAPSSDGERPGRRRGGTRPSALRVVVVHPDLLGTYGDAGNGRVLAARAAWRGVDAELVLAESGRPLPGSGDVYCLGGGEDGPELQAAEQLRGGVLAGAVADGAVVLAVCAGYQLAGSRFPDAGGAPRDGLGLLDVVTAKGTGKRAVGELLAEPGPLGQAALPTLTGFENHSGLTTLGPGARPLASVRSGIGNGDGTEGAWQGTVFGTYLHGPVLARNPGLADLLLATATGEPMVPLEDGEEQALRHERLAAVSASRRVRVRRA